MVVRMSLSSLMICIMRRLSWSPCTSNSLELGERGEQYLSCMRGLKPWGTFMTEREVLFCTLARGTYIRCDPVDSVLAKLSAARSA